MPVITVNHVSKLQRNEIYSQLKFMPPLPHYPDRSQPFDWNESRVIDHIMLLLFEEDLPATMRMAQGIFNKAHKKQCILFDRATGLWRGNPNWEPL